MSAFLKRKVCNIDCKTVLVDSLSNFHPFFETTSEITGRSENDVFFETTFGNKKNYKYLLATNWLNVL